MSQGARATAAVVGTLALAGILATVALGESCAAAVENDVRYVGHEVPYATPARGSLLGEAEILDCAAGGRCAPPADTAEIFALAGIAPEIAVATAAGGQGDVLLAPGTFPALPAHPLHEAFFGTAARPTYRERCGEPFRFAGEVVEARFNLRVDVAEQEPDELEGLVGLEEDDGLVWLELDAETRVDGFDRDGVVTIDPGQPIEVVARVCEGELAGALADSIERP